MKKTAKRKKKKTTEMKTKKKTAMSFQICFVIILKLTSIMIKNRNLYRQKTNNLMISSKKYSNKRWLRMKPSKKKI